MYQTNVKLACAPHLPQMSRAEIIRSGIARIRRPREPWTFNRRSAPFDMTIAPSKVLAFIFPSRQSTAIDKLRPQTRPTGQSEAAALERTGPDIIGHRLSTAAFGDIRQSRWLTIEFARHSNLIATIWPSNAIILAVLLRYAHGPILYSLLLAGGTAANSVGRVGCRKRTAFFASPCSRRTLSRSPPHWRY